MKKEIYVLYKQNKKMKDKKRKFITNGIRICNLNFRHMYKLTLTFYFFLNYSISKHIQQNMYQFFMADLSTKIQRNERVTLCDFLVRQN